MKKIFLTVLSFVWLNILLAQEKPYLVQMHFMEVKGDINAFIEDNSKFFKPMALGATTPIPVITTLFFIIYF